jgi:hypothetical protein
MLLSVRSGGVPEDPTKEPGRLMGVDGGYGSRSQFETAGIASGGSHQTPC